MKSSHDCEDVERCGTSRVPDRARIKPHLDPATDWPRNERTRWRWRKKAFMVRQTIRNMSRIPNGHVDDFGLELRTTSRRGWAL